MSEDRPWHPRDGVDGFTGISQAAGERACQMKLAEARRWAAWEDEAVSAPARDSLTDFWRGFRRGFLLKRD